MPPKCGPGRTAMNQCSSRLRSIAQTVLEAASNNLLPSQTVGVAGEIALGHGPRGGPRCQSGPRRRIRQPRNVKAAMLTKELSLMVGALPLRYEPGGSGRHRQLVSNSFAYGCDEPKTERQGCFSSSQRRASNTFPCTPSPRAVSSHRQRCAVFAASPRSPSRHLVFPQRKGFRWLAQAVPGSRPRVRVRNPPEPLSRRMTGGQPRSTSSPR